MRVERIVVECEKTGLQIELIVRQYSEDNPGVTHEIQPSKAQAKSVATAIKRSLDKKTGAE